MTEDFPLFKKATEAIRLGTFGEEEFTTATGKIVVVTHSSAMLGTVVDMEFDLNEEELQQLIDHYNTETKSIIKGFLFDPSNAPDGITLPPGFAWHYEGEPSGSDAYNDVHRVRVSFVMSARQGILQVAGGSLLAGVSISGGVPTVERLQLGDLGAELTGGNARQAWELPAGIEIVYSESAQPSRFAGLGTELVGGEPSAGGGDPIRSLRQLILHFEGANGSTLIVDSSQYNRSVIAYGGAALTTANKLYGTAGLRSPGTTLSKIAFSIPGGLGTGAFCLEWFEYLYTADSSRVTFNSRVSGATSATGIGINEDGRATTQNLWIFGESLPSPAKQLLTWRHVAIVRRADLVMLRFYNGQQTGISAFPVTNNFEAPNFEFSGSDGIFPSYQQGDYDELRITVGDPVYLSSFIPPTSPHPDT
jgi:hypothetical protein